MTATAAATPMSADLPVLLAELEVVSVERTGPSFVRVELGGPELAELGVDGPWWDQRIKLVLPDPTTGATPSVEGADASWLASWLERPAAERGHLRTYTVREVRGSGRRTTLVVDMVLHLEGDLVGPGSLWAAAAAPGDRIVVLGPRRGFAYGGIEFSPPPGARLILAGDETAVPAVCAILEQLRDDARGAVFLEVPTSGDVQDVRRPPGVDVTWLPRDGAVLGTLLHAAVVSHLGIPGATAEVAADEVDPDLWETPSYSSSGEEVGGDVAGGDVAGGDVAEGVYAWIAGESRVVTGLRRHLVTDVGMDRSRVAFMGYWRRGVAMRS